MDFHDQLDVFLNENKIGTLFTDNGVMSFAYDTEFLNTPLINSISCFGRNL